MAEGVLLRLDVRCDERAPARVRCSLGELEGIADASDDLKVIASELVTNAILHSGCDEEDLLAVELGYREGRLMLSVRDPGASGDSAALAGARTPGHGGLGLKIVQLLAERWGEQRGDGYLVWAELPESVTA